MEPQRRYASVSDPSRRPSPAQAGSAGRSVQGDATAPPGHPGSQGSIGYHYSQGGYALHQPPGVGPPMRSQETHTVGVSTASVVAQRLQPPGYAVPQASGGRTHPSARVSSPDYRGYQHGPSVTPVAAAAGSSGSPASGATGAPVVAVDSPRASVGVYGEGPGGVADPGMPVSVAQHMAAAHQKHHFGGPSVGPGVAGSGVGMVATGGSGSAGSGGGGVSHSSLSGRQGGYGMSQSASSPQHQQHQQRQSQHPHQQQQQQHRHPQHQHQRQHQQQQQQHHHHHHHQQQQQQQQNYRGGVQQHQQQPHQTNAVPPPAAVYKSSARGPYSIPTAVARAPPQVAAWQPGSAGSGHGVPPIASGPGVGDAKSNSSANIANKGSSPASQDGQSAPGAPKGGVGHRQQSGNSSAGGDGYVSGKNTGGAEAVGSGSGSRGGSGGAVDGGGGGAVASSTRGDNNFQEQMSPSAVQAIKQISKLRAAPYHQSIQLEKSEDEDDRGYDSAEEQSGARVQGWRPPVRGSAYSPSARSRPTSERHDAKESARATLGQLAAKVHAEEKNRRSRASMGGDGSGDGDDAVGPVGSSGASGGGPGGGGGGVGSDGGGSGVGDEEEGEGDSEDDGGGGGSGERGVGGSEGGGRGSVGRDGATAAAAAMGTGENSDGDGMSEESDGEGGTLGLCAPGTEQTGRWTKDEHDLFLKALKKFGKEWKRVACMVKTRTVVQTRTHAQKYFQKLTKAAQGGGISLEDGDAPELMDIEVHMNTIDPAQPITSNNSNNINSQNNSNSSTNSNHNSGSSSSSRTRGGPKRSRASTQPAVVGEREGLRARNPRRKYPYPSDEEDDGDDDDDGGGGGGGGGNVSITGTNSGGNNRRSRGKGIDKKGSGVGSSNNNSSAGTGAGTGSNSSSRVRPSTTGSMATSRGSNAASGGAGSGSRTLDDLDRERGVGHPYYYAPSSTFGRRSNIGGGRGGGGRYGGGGGGPGGGAGGRGARGREEFGGYGRGPAMAQRQYPAMGPGDRPAAQRLNMVSPIRGGGRMGGGRGVRGGSSSSRGGRGGRGDRSDRIIDRRLAPSPPGEGSRKNEEMAVAELLANSSRISQDFGGMSVGDRRSNTRGEMAMAMDMDMGMAGPAMAGIRSRVEGGSVVGGGRGRGGGERGGAASGLRITNPELLGSGAAAVAHTPWDGEVSNLPDGFPSSRSRTTPKEEAPNDFVESYSKSNGSGGPQVGGALHRNISQGRVAGALKLIDDARAFRDRKRMAKEAGLRGGGGAAASPGGEASKSPRAASGAAADGGSKVEASEGLHGRDENPGGGRVGEGVKSGVGAAKTASDPMVDEVQAVDSKGDAIGPATSSSTAEERTASTASEGQQQQQRLAAETSPKKAFADGSAVGDGAKMEIDSESAAPAAKEATAAAQQAGTKAKSEAEAKSEAKGDQIDPLVDLVNEVDKFGFTPLMLAASMQRAPGDRGGIGTGPDTAYSLCEALLAHGAKHFAADSAGNTALHWAAWVGNHLVVQLLSAQITSEDINRQNEEGDSALHFASRWGGEQAVHVLLMAGASPQIKNSEGRVPLQVAGDGNALEGNTDSESRNRVRREFFRQDPRNRTLILHHRDCLEHQPKSERDWECPDRVLAILDLLESEVFDSHELEITSDFSAVNTEALTRAHSGAYIKFVNGLGKKLEAEDASKSLPFTPMLQQYLFKKEDRDVKPIESCDTSFSKGSLRAARRAAGAVTHAVDAVMTGRNRNAFCAVRPPGHHAGTNGLLEDAVSCGFCIFNNVAVGAMHALNRHKLDRVAIVDFDVHHGNGTEEICRAFTEPHRLLFFSIHLYDKCPPYEFFPGSGENDDLVGNIINAPLTPLWKGKEKSSQQQQQRRYLQQQHYQQQRQPHGTRSRTSSTKARQPQGPVDYEQEQQRWPGSGRLGYREAIQLRLLPALRAFNPQLILVSAGFDAAKGDVGNCKQERRGFSGGLDLTSEDYLWTTEKIQNVADICCRGKVVSVLEGGYGRSLRDLPAATAAATSASLTRPHSAPAGSGHSGLYPPSPILDNHGGAGVLHVGSGGRGGGGGGSHAMRGNGTANPNPNLPLERIYQPDTPQNLQRDELANNVVAHVRGLVDPYQSQVGEKALRRQRHKEKENDGIEPDRKKVRMGH